MKRQLLILVIFTLLSSVAFAQPYYLRGAQSGSGPCDWGNFNSACELTDPDSDGVFTVIAVPDATEFKIYNAGNSTWYPNNNAWVVTGNSTKFSIEPSNNNQVGVYEGDVFDICAPSAFGSPMWDNATPMERTDSGNGSTYCIVIPVPGTYGWKPTKCGSWDTFYDPGTVRALASSNPADWSVTTTSPNQKVCVFYDRTLGLITNSVITVPVELTKFKGKIADAGIELNWSTQVEINNDYFIIERSQKGSDFEAIGMVDGNGNSHVKLDYQYTDDTPIIGVNRYRLRQVDYDGTSSYSKIVQVSFYQDQGPTIIYPNPASNWITVEGLSNQASTLDIISIIDQRLEYTSNLEPNVNLPIDNLQSGLYIVRVMDKDGHILHQEKLIKL